MGGERGRGKREGERDREGEGGREGEMFWWEGRRQVTMRAVDAIIDSE